MRSRRVNGRNFGTRSDLGGRCRVTKLERTLIDIRDRLAGVTIKQLGIADFIRRYQRAGMLFYLDPPYWGCETGYGQDVFGRAYFDQLAEQLAGIMGRFVLSINDTPGAARRSLASTYRRPKRRTLSGRERRSGSAS